MAFEWDDFKNLSNFRNHKIWFEEAQTIWEDDQSVEFYDPDHSGMNEDRFIRIGHSRRSRIIMVVFCERNEDIVRIISSRKATNLEIRQYEEGI